MAKKWGGGLDSLQIYRGDWEKNWGWCFQGGGVDTPMHTIMQNKNICEYFLETKNSYMQKNCQHTKQHFSFKRAPFQVSAQPAFTYSKLTIETLQQVVKYVQSDVIDTALVSLLLHLNIFQTFF